MVDQARLAAAELRALPQLRAEAFEDVDPLLELAQRHIADRVGEDSPE
jgi:hypothetical protein